MPTRSSSLMIQTSQGKKGNFTMVTPSPNGGLTYCWRENDKSGFPWNGFEYFGAGTHEYASIFETTLKVIHDQKVITEVKPEVVARKGNDLVHYERRSKGPGLPIVWHGPSKIASDITGNPAFIQSTYGKNGNYEVVVPLLTGGLAHYSRDNDIIGKPVWKAPTIFGKSTGVFHAATLIESNFGAPGNLEVVARQNDKLLHFWRDAALKWHGPDTILSSSAVGIPGFIQSGFGNKGNFELVTPLVGGGMRHFWRNNDNSSHPWSGTVTFGKSLGNIKAVGLIESNFAIFNIKEWGNLEVVAQAKSSTFHFWRPFVYPIWYGRNKTCKEPTCNPKIQGKWEVPYMCNVVGVHTSLLYTDPSSDIPGQVLFFSYYEKNGVDDHKRGESAVLDLNTGKTTEPIIKKNLFCAGHTFLPDGRLLVAGGHDTGVKSIHTFTPGGPSGGAWNDILNMPLPRWYPTCTTLDDGRIFIISGTANTGPVSDVNKCKIVRSVNDTYEISSSITAFHRRYFIKTAKSTYSPKP